MAVVEPLHGAAPDGAELAGVAAALISEAPDGWTSTHARCEVSLGESYTFEQVFVLADGGEASQFTPDAADDLLVELREGMAARGSGTWFTAEVDVTAAGEFRFDFGYDTPVPDDDDDDDD